MYWLLFECKNLFLWLFLVTTKYSFVGRVDCRKTSSTSSFSIVIESIPSNGIAYFYYDERYIRQMQSSKFYFIYIPITALICF